MQAYEHRPRHLREADRRVGERDRRPAPGSRSLTHATWGGTMNAHASENQTHTATEGTDVAFTFVQALAAELSGGNVELPGFPHIVMQVKRVLADAGADARRI